MTGNILIAGDLFPNEKNLADFRAGAVDALFGDKLVGMFANADLTLCNLEGALSDSGERGVKTGPVKVAPADAVAAYRKLGVDVCLLANNHVTDGSAQGVRDTLKALAGAGIHAVGAGEDEASIPHSFVREVGGVRFGFYNVSETMYNKPGRDVPGVWLYDEYVVCRELAECKRSCDYLVVIYHGGIEKFPFPSPETRKRFYRMADNGADLIVAQHTHCVGCEERYHGSRLIYGQGDFLLKNFAPGLTDTGLLLELAVEDGQVDVRKHLVRVVDEKCVRYAEKQDFAAYDARSAQVGDEDYVYRQLQKFCEGELRLYLTAFKSPSRLRVRLARLFPKAYRKWLFGYRERDLRFALHTLRSEQNRETAIIGIQDLLQSGGYRR